MDIQFLNSFQNVIQHFAGISNHQVFFQEISMLERDGGAANLAYNLKNLHTLTEFLENDKTNIEPVQVQILKDKISNDIEKNGYTILEKEAENLITNSKYSINFDKYFLITKNIETGSLKKEINKLIGKDKFVVEGTTATVSLCYCYSNCHGDCYCHSACKAAAW